MENNKGNMKKTKLAYWILSGIFIFEMIMVLISNIILKMVGIYALIIKIMASISTINSFDELVNAVRIISVLIGIFVISYLILFIKNFIEEKKKIIAILPLLLCICFTFAPTLGTNIRRNYDRNQADRIIISTPVSVDLSEIGLGIYSEISSADFGENNDYFSLYDTSQKIDSGMSSRGTFCSYKSFIEDKYYPNDYLDAKKYNYKGVDIYFLYYYGGNEIHLKIGSRIYKIFRVEDRLDEEDFTKRKKIFDDLIKYNNILEKIKNNSELLPI